MAASRPLNRTYLDYNATAPLRPEAREAAIMAMETTGNPSSIHADGRAARGIIEDARREVARLAGVGSARVTFVSGAPKRRTLRSIPLFGGGPNAAPLERLIVSAGEHACVLSGHRFPTAEECAVAAGWAHRSRLARGRLPSPWPRAGGAARRKQRDGC